jgi:hypothetical protein
MYVREIVCSLSKFRNTEIRNGNQYSVYEIADDEFMFCLSCDWLITTLSETITKIK